MIPEEATVAIQVDTVAGEFTAIGAIGVFAPEKALLDPATSIGIGLGNNVDAVVVEQPCQVRVGAVSCEKHVGETGSNFCGRQFAGVLRGHHHQLALLKAGGLAVRQDEHLDVGASQAPGADFVPTVANVAQVGQVRVLLGQRLQIGEGLRHCAVAGIAGNAAAVGLGLEGAGVGQGRGELRLFQKGEAAVGQPHLLCRRHERDSGFLLRLDVPDIDPLEKGMEGFSVCVVDAGNDGSGGVVLLAGVHGGRGVNAGGVEQDFSGRF